MGAPPPHAANQAPDSTCAQGGVCGPSTTIRPSPHSSPTGHKGETNTGANTQPDAPAANMPRRPWPRPQPYLGHRLVCTNRGRPLPDWHRSCRPHTGRPRRNDDTSANKRRRFVDFDFPCDRVLGGINIGYTDPSAQLPRRTAPAQTSTRLPLSPFGVEGDEKPLFMGFGRDPGDLNNAD